MMARINVSPGGLLPVVQHRLPTAGLTPILHIYLSEERDGYAQPSLGLSASSSYRAHVLRADASRPATFELVAGPVHDGRCGFWEIDPQLMPGLYGFQVGSTLRCRVYTFVYLRFAAARPLYLQLQGVEYDPYDASTLGLATWIRATCHEHLSSGLRKSMPATLRPLLADWLTRESKEKPWNSL